MTATSPVTIRPYRPDDLDALRDICVKTGLYGKDATPHYRDPQVLPAVFAEPYAELEPELAFVADNGERAIGYVVGAADSTAFFAAFRSRWLPRVADRFPEPAGAPEGPEEVVRYLLHHAETMLDPEIAAEYPAHLHIDLLPEGQRQGLGRRLITTLFDALRDRGVPGVHLGMSPANTGARLFYERIGLTLLPRRGDGDVLHFAQRL
ncbi:GNAT family N-acetyltransferase [Streptomyces johnsoniae]|uniref:GNAT family N-acetyltransferase n=1 Tax=Streptomyces johnsoniae TaxID=3075532 RepID=A0ABU2SCP5_9ACTN|nr:GNAT family N-acetyltransferase [Streptomyces sp. DSM 41886]MDT0446742.1 GNAT family N-acetyltransferase [Streptomyces sp. DSM 41886]